MKRQNKVANKHEPRINLPITGKIVRFGPNSLSFNSNSALRDIYGFKSNVRKAAFYDAFAHPVPNTHNTRDKHVHARKRRVLSQAFSDSAMKEMERYILANVRSFCEQIGRLGGGGNNEGSIEERKGWTVAKNMADWCNYLAMDILGELCYGKAFHMLEQPDNRYALELVSLATTRHLIVSIPERDRTQRNENYGNQRILIERRVIVRNYASCGEAEP